MTFICMTKLLACVLGSVTPSLVRLVEALQYKSMLSQLSLAFIGNFFVRFGLGWGMIQSLEPITCTFRFFYATV